MSLLYWIMKDDMRTGGAVRILRLGGESLPPLPGLGRGLLPAEATLRLGVTYKDLSYGVGQGTDRQKCAPAY